MGRGRHEKRRHAGHLFVHGGLDGREISEILGVSEKSISRWRNEDGWEDQRTALLTTKPQELRRMYAQLKELNDLIEGREPGKRYPNSKEADTQTKLATAIKRLEEEAGLAATIDVFIAFTEWLRKRDLAKAQQWSDVQDQYIKHLVAS